MKYYIAMSNRDKDYIIIRENMSYCWFKNLPNKLELSDLCSDGTSTDINEWLRKLKVRNMTLLCSFSNYDEVKVNYPELFI